MLRMIAVALKICLCGEDSDDCEVVIRCGETDIAATYVAFDTVEVGDEGAERVGGGSGLFGGELAFTLTPLYWPRGVR